AMGGDFQIQRLAQAVRVITQQLQESALGSAVGQTGRAAQCIVRLTQPDQQADQVFGAGQVWYKIQSLNRQALEGEQVFYQRRIAPERNIVLAHRVVANQREQPAQAVRAAGGIQVGFTLAAVEGIGNLVEHYRQGFHQYDFNIRRCPAAALGEATRQLFEHKQPKTVVVALQPVEIIADLRQRAWQFHLPLAAVAAAFAKGEQGLGNLRHHTPPATSNSTRSVWLSAVRR